MLPEWTWRIDGRPADLGDWAASADVFGYDRASGTIEEDVARRVGQGSRLVGYVAGRVGWDGRLSRDPFLARGQARIDAAGHQAQAAKYRKRLLYQSRDVSAFVPRGGPPWNVAESGVHFGAETRPGDLLWKIEQGQPVLNTEHQSLIWPAPKTVGGLTRYAFSWRSQNATTALVLKTFRGTHPGDTLTAIGVPSLNAASGAEDTTFGGGSDELAIQLIATTNFTPNFYYVQLYDFRVNGRVPPGAPDIMATSALAKDVLALLGIDSTRVTTSPINALPFDGIGESALDVLGYMATLDDWHPPRILGDGKAIYAEYGPWGGPQGERIHTVYLARGAEPELVRLEDFNEVRVLFPHVGGYEGEIIRTVEDLGLPNPLEGAVNADGTPLRNTADMAIGDPQPNSNLAVASADEHLMHVSSRRFSGRLQAVEVRSGDVYDPLPGDVIRVADFGPLEAADLRLFAAEWRKDGATWGIEAQATTGLLARAALAVAPPVGPIPTYTPPEVGPEGPEDLGEAPHKHKHGGKHHGTWHKRAHVHEHFHAPPYKPPGYEAQHLPGKPKKKKKKP